MLEDHYAENFFNILIAKRKLCVAIRYD